MRRRRPTLGPWEYAALALFLVVLLYTGWVIWDVHDSSKNETAAPAPARPSSPSPSVEVAAPEAPATPPPLGPFTEAASTADTILVIGDSTGAGSGGWVDLVASDLGEKHHVTLHEWDEPSGQFEVPTTYGGGGVQLDLWNLSLSGVDTDYAAHLGDVPRPDVVLIDIGHDRGPRALARTATATLDAVGARWGDVPTAFVLQNPSVLDKESQQRRGVRRLTKLAADYADPVIDVYTAFENATSADPLVTDDSRPTEAGSRLWADVVDKALDTTPAN